MASRVCAIVVVVVVSCVSLVGGCGGAGGQPVQRSSSLRPAVATPGEEALVVGMDLGDALEMITRHGIDFQIDGGDWGPEREVAAAQMFVIERRDIDDALIIYADSERGERMRVRDLHWWRNYQADIKRAKGERKVPYAHIKSVSMTEIEREYSLARNPYDTEKVRAREGNR